MKEHTKRGIKIGALWILYFTIGTAITFVNPDLKFPVHLRIFFGTLTLTLAIGCMIVLYFINEIIQEIVSPEKENNEIIENTESNETT